MKTRSIGFRLAAWYFLVFAAGAAAFGIAAWFGMRASLYDAVDDGLRDRVRGVQTFVQSQIAELSLPEMRDEFREHSVLGPGGDLLQVCDQHGAWLFRSEPLESNNVAITLPGDLRSPRFETGQVDRHPMRFYSQRITIDGAPYTVEIAVPLDEVFGALERFRTLLLLVAPVLLIGASAGGYWISRRALAPVDEISRAAQRISIENLTQRLRVPRSGDELQRLSETLNAMLARLDASVRRMAQFTADASHELRAPVALIRTTAEVATLRRDRPSSEYLDALDDILEESERTSQVVESLMLLARSDAGGASVERHDLDARSVVREAAEQGEKLAHSNGLEFRLETADLPVPIQGDPESLRRALLILIDNAIKYTPGGGTVRVRLCADQDRAVVSVSDTGIGIAEDDLPHIFERFWRADRARTRERAGAGLGLSIAKQIVEMHSGSIRVESRPGKGSTFQILLPLNGEESSVA